MMDIQNDLKQEISEIISKKTDEKDKLWQLMRILQRFGGFLDEKFSTIEKNLVSEKETIWRAFQDELASLKDSSDVHEKVDELHEDIETKVREIVGAIPVPKNGKDGAMGERGEDGFVPVKGKDYFTQVEMKDFLKSATPIKGIHYTDGTDGKSIKGDSGEDGSPDTPEQIIEKINSSKSQIDASQIKNLPRARQISGGGGDVVTYSSDDGTITGTINGTNKVFTLSAPLKNPVVFADGLRMTKTFDYTITGTTLTFVVAPEQIITVDGQNA